MKANILKTKRATEVASRKLFDLIIDSILDKKGENIVSLDLTNLEDAIADYFIICEGSSSTQIKAIAQNIVSTAKQQLNERPTSKDGETTSEWILIDYTNIMIHVFSKKARSTYKIEELWGDAGTVTAHLEDGTTTAINVMDLYLSEADN